MDYPAVPGKASRTCFFQSEMEVKYLDKFLPFDWERMLKEIAGLVSLAIVATRVRVLVKKLQ